MKFIILGAMLLFSNTSFSARYYADPSEVMFSIYDSSLGPINNKIVIEWTDENGVEQEFRYLPLDRNHRVNVLKDSYIETFNHIKDLAIELGRKVEIDTTARGAAKIRVSNFVFE